MSILTTLQTLAKGIVVIAISWLVRFLYQGISVRVKFYNMRRRGMPVPEPYSLLTGHIPFMKAWKGDLPKDAHGSYIGSQLVMNWRTYFPNLTECPPVVYIDLWPLAAVPMIYVIHGDTCAQLTQETPQPRSPMFAAAIWPVTGSKDLIAMDGAAHRLWRSRLSPGFSMRNLQSLMPDLVEEVGIFADKVKAHVGADGGWGAAFPLEEKTERLTFDIIIRSALGLRTHEQTTGPGQFITSFRHLITYVKTASLRTRIERMIPSQKKDMAYHNKIIRDILLPQIKSCMDRKPDPGSEKTVVNLAVKELQNETDGKGSEQASDEFIEIVISQLKLFILAGHDTTAQAMCWVFYEIHKYPAILAQVRAEHDEILGSDPQAAREVLLQHPQKLNELKYTTAVIKETLRVHSLGSTHRQGSANFNFLHNGIRYPTKGTTIFTSPTATQLRDDVWPRPREFIPERFLVGEDDPLRPVKNAYRPFELGNMRCIGEELAMMEMKLALLFTIREMDFDFGVGDPDTRPPPTGDVLNVYGDPVYRVGISIGSVKDNLPTHVRMR